MHGLLYPTCRIVLFFLGAGVLNRCVVRHFQKRGLSLSISLIQVPVLWVLIFFLLAVFLTSVISDCICFHFLSTREAIVGRERPVVFSSFSLGRFFVFWCCCISQSADRGAIQFKRSFYGFNPDLFDYCAADWNCFGLHILYS